MPLLIQDLLKPHRRGRQAACSAGLFLRLLCFLAVTVTGPVTAGPVWADEQRYVYDPLGRLYQVIDTAGNTATYHYDAVGNLLAITRTTTQPAPVVTGITPSQARAGETVNVTITGSNLLGATLSTTHAGLTVSHVTAAPTQITATFAIAETAAQGTATIQVTTAAGSVTVGFTVLPPSPALTLAPQVVNLEVGQTVTFTVGIIQTDPYAVVVTFSLTDPAIAKVTPVQVSIPAGQLTQTVTVTGSAGGNTTLVAKAGGKQAQAAITVYPPYVGTLIANASAVSVAFPQAAVPTTLHAAALPLSVAFPPSALPPTTLLTASPAVSVAFPVNAQPMTLGPVIAPKVSVAIPAGSQPVTWGPVEAGSVSVAFPTSSQLMVLGPVGATGVSVQIAEGLGAEMMGPVMAPSVSATISQ
jgi:YD repeat-containing protein